MKDNRLLEVKTSVNTHVPNRERTDDVRIETAQIMSIPQMFHS